MVQSLEPVADGVRRQIASAVQDAEDKTAAEFVPVLARTSGRYERAEDVCGLIGAVIAVTAAATVLPHGSGSVHAVHVIAMALACIIGAVIGVGVGAMVPAVKRLFTTSSRQQAALDAKARELFSARKVHQTTSGTGVVIMVSLFERRGVLLCDQVVRDHLNQSVIETCERRLLGCRTPHEAAAGMSDVMALLGDHLGDVLPRYDHDANELPDALVVLD